MADRPRGGMLQRAKQSLAQMQAGGGEPAPASASGARIERPNNLAHLLLQEWSWGETSAAKVQRHAHAAWKDMLVVKKQEAEVKELEALASLG
eukprot:12384328-Karenia_brevis.AAC.1